MTNHFLFKDRREAGKRLGEQLFPYKFKNPLVLALPRGGVPVGYEVATILDAPLDTIIARKIGLPGHPEYGIGAVAPEVTVLNNAVIESLGIEREEIAESLKRETEEMYRRMNRYKTGGMSEGVEADTVIVVDDGVATGVTALAALRSVRNSHRPERLVFAAPICARDTAERLRQEAEVISMYEIHNLMTIGMWYRDFNQLTDEEVLRMLRKRVKEESEVVGNFVLSPTK